MDKLKTRPYDGPGDSSLPDSVKEMPKKAKEIWVAAYNSAYENYDPDTSEQDSKEGYANAVAWGAVNKKFKKNKDGKWVAREYVLNSYEAPLIRVREKDGGAVTWESTVSDDGVDKYATRMTVDLHDDFIRNAEQVGMPFLTIAHFQQLARVGRADRLWRDGRRLKASGHFFTDHEDELTRELARAAADTALKDMQLPPRQRAVRTSIGFKPGPGGVLTEDLGVLAYIRGHLPEITMTTHPGNSRVNFSSERSDEMKVRISADFMEEDAATIVGPDLAAKLREKFDAVAGRSSEADPIEIIYRAVEQGKATLDDLATLLAAGFTATEAERGDLAKRYANVNRTPPWDRDDANIMNRLEDLDDLSILQEADLVDEAKVAVARAKLSLDVAMRNVTEGFGDVEISDADGDDVIRIKTDLYGEQELDLVSPEEVELVERSGRRLQGKRLTDLQGVAEQLESAATGLKELVRWATKEGEDDDARTFDMKGIMAIAREVSPDQSFERHLVTRLGGTDPDDSLIETMELHSMMQVAFEAAMTLTDIVAANLDPDQEIVLEERMKNVDNALTEFGQVVGWMIVSAYGGGRSKPKETPKSVTGDGDGSGTVNAGNRSNGEPDLTGLDSTLANIRQLVHDGASPEQLQEALEAEVAAIRDLRPGPEEEHEPDEHSVERIAGLEIRMEQIAAGMEELLAAKDVSESPPAPDTRPVPRRRSLPAGPPASPRTDTQPRQTGGSRLGQAKRLTISQAVDQSRTGMPYP